MGQENSVHYTTRYCLTLNLCLKRLKGSLFLQDHFKGGAFLGIPVHLFFLCRIQNKGHFGLALLEGWLLKMVFAKLPSVFACSLHLPRPFYGYQVYRRNYVQPPWRKKPAGCHMQIESQSLANKFHCPPL